MEITSDPRPQATSVVLVRRSTTVNEVKKTKCDLFVCESNSARESEILVQL